MTGVLKQRPVRTGPVMIRDITLCTLSVIRAYAITGDNRMPVVNDRPGDRMPVQEFEAVLIKDDGTNGLYIRIPFNVQEVFNKKSQVKVKGSIDGYPYRGSIHPYGGIHYMGVKKEIREAIGKAQGDTVKVVMEMDTQPGTVIVPVKLEDALKKDKKAKAAFEKLSYTHKKEYVEWIECAKKEETRDRRIKKAIERLTGRM